MAKSKTCSKCGAERSGAICPKCQHEHKRGGARANAGAKKRTLDAPVPIDGRTKAGRSIAAQVLEVVKIEKLWVSLVRLECDRLGIAEDGTLARPAPRKSEGLIDGKVSNADEVIDGPDYAGKFSIIPLTNLLRYLEDRAHGKTVDNVNHIHNKPVELNVTHSLSDRMRIAISKAEQRIANR